MTEASDPGVGLDPFVRLLARQAARHHFRFRGYTILCVPVLLAIVVAVLIGGLVFGRMLGGR